jgi:hypothetical protein
MWPDLKRSARFACLAAAAAMILAPACAERPAPVATAATLQFIADDFPRAQDEAKRRSVPIFVEAWAPW